MKKQTQGSENGKHPNDEPKMKGTPLPGINPDEVIFVSPILRNEATGKVSRLPGHWEMGGRRRG